MSDHRPMTTQELEDALYIAMRVNAARLPKRPGAGKNFVPPHETDAAVRAFAKVVAESLLRSNLKPYKGPPAAMRTY